MALKAPATTANKPPSLLACNEQVLCWVPEDILLTPWLISDDSHFVPANPSVKSVLTTSVCLCVEKIADELVGSLGAEPQVEPFTRHLKDLLHKLRELRKRALPVGDSQPVGGRGCAPSPTVPVHRITGMLLEVRTVQPSASSEILLVGYVRWKEEDDNRSGSWIPMEFVARRTNVAVSMVPPFVVVGLLRYFLRQEQGIVVGGASFIANATPLSVGPIPSRTPHEPVIPHTAARVYLDTFKKFLSSPQSLGGVAEETAGASLATLVDSVPPLASGAAVLGKERLMGILEDSQMRGLTFEHPLKSVSEEHLQTSLGERKALEYLEGRLLRDVRCLPNQHSLIRYAEAGPGGGFAFPPWYYSPTDLVFGGQGLVGPRGHYPQLTAMRLQKEHEALGGRPQPDGLHDPFKLKNVFLCPFTLRQYSSQRQLKREHQLLAQLYVRMRLEPPRPPSHPIHIAAGSAIKQCIGQPSHRYFPFCPRGKEIYCDDVRGVSVFEVSAPKPTTVPTPPGVKPSGRFAPLHILESVASGTTAENEAQLCWGRYLHLKGLIDGPPEATAPSILPNSKGSQHEPASATLPNREYCRNIFLLAKAFLENKLCGHDVHMYTFYVVALHASVHFPDYQSYVTQTVEAAIARHHAHQGGGSERNPPPLGPPSDALLFAGFYSWEAKAADNANLACIMTLPCMSSIPSTQGLGQFLVRLSYEVAFRRGFIGSPERPLSDLGEKMYHSFWRRSILLWGAMVVRHLDRRKAVQQQPGMRSTPATPLQPEAIGGVGHGKGFVSAPDQQRETSPEPAKLGSKRNREESAESVSSNSSRSSSSRSMSTSVPPVAPQRRRLFAVRKKETEADLIAKNLPVATAEFIRRGVREWGCLGKSAAQQNNWIGSAYGNHIILASTLLKDSDFEGITDVEQFDEDAYLDRWLFHDQSPAFDDIPGVEVLVGANNESCIKCTTASIAKWCGIEPSDCQEVLMEMGLLHCSALGDQTVFAPKRSPIDLSRSSSQPTPPPTHQESTFKFLSSTTCPVNGHYLSLILPVEALRTIIQTEVKTKVTAMRAIQPRVQARSDAQTPPFTSERIPLAFDSRLLVWKPTSGLQQQ